MKSQKQPFSTLPGNSQGFTLIETMIALLVFTVGIMAVMTLTVSAINGFTRSGITSTEVNRTALNLETLKEVGYSNSAAFIGAPTTPVGTDGVTVGYNDTNNAVVAETKLIVMDNNAMKGGSANSTYEVYYTKPLIE